MEEWNEYGELRQHVKVVAIPGQKTEIASKLNKDLNKENVAPTSTASKPVKRKKDTLANSVTNAKSRVPSDTAYKPASSNLVLKEQIFEADPQATAMRTLADQVAAKAKEKERARIKANAANVRRSFLFTPSAKEGPLESLAAIATSAQMQSPGSTSWNREPEGIMSIVGEISKAYSPSAPAPHDRDASILSSPIVKQDIVSGVRDTTSIQSPGTSRWKSLNEDDIFTCQASSQHIRAFEKSCSSTIKPIASATPTLSKDETTDEETNNTPHPKEAQEAHAKKDAVMKELVAKDAEKKIAAKKAMFEQNGSESKIESKKSATMDTSKTMTEQKLVPDKITTDAAMRLVDAAILKISTEPKTTQAKENPIVFTKSTEKSSAEEQQIVTKSVNLQDDDQKTNVEMSSATKGSGPTYSETTSTNVHVPTEQTTQPELEDVRPVTTDKDTTDESTALKVEGETRCELSEERIDAEGAQESARIEKEQEHTRPQQEEAAEAAKSVVSEQAEIKRVEEEKAQAAIAAQEQQEIAEAKDKQKEHDRREKEEAEKVERQAEVQRIEDQKTRAAIEAQEKQKIAEAEAQAKKAESDRLRTEEAQKAETLRLNEEKVRLATEVQEKQKIVEAEAKKAESDRLEKEEAQKADQKAEALRLEEEKTRQLEANKESAKLAASAQAEEDERKRLAVEKAEQVDIEAERERLAAEEAEMARLEAEEKQKRLETERLETEAKAKKEDIARLAAIADEKSKQAEKEALLKQEEENKRKALTEAKAAADAAQKVLDDEKEARDKKALEDLAELEALEKQLAMLEMMNAEVEMAAGKGKGKPKGS